MSTTTDLRVIIVGGGHVGFHTAEHLHNRGHDVVVIERDSTRSAHIQDAYIATVIEGDATRPSIIRQAQPDRSDVIASLIGDQPGTNVGICMTAQRMAPDIATVARIDHGETEEYDGLIDRVVFPERLGAHVATNEIMDVTGSGVRTIEEVADDLELLEIEVTADAPVANKTLAEVRFPVGVVVIPHGEIDATGDTILEPGRRYIIAARPDVTDEVVRLFRG